MSTLEVAWTYSTGEAADSFATARPTSLEVTPLVLDGIMYLSTPLGRVISLDAATGAERWAYDPHVDRTIEFGDFTSRGVSSWIDSAAPAGSICRHRLFVATIDARLIALDAPTGRLCDRFGTDGTVDLRRTLRNAPFETAEYAVTSPPAIINGRVVIGSAVADNNRTDAASGEVRAYDARTGAPLWAWDPVPQDSSDPAYNSWRGDAAHRTGAANAWSVIAADPARDLVFVPTSAPSPDYYGGERLGSNRYANSVVALRASTGAVVWSFQTVHHDLWDYDNAAPPALVTVRRGGREVPAVLQATKTGQLFVLHRDTGEPLFPVMERPVPPSTVPGEVAWPTQPFSSILLADTARARVGRGWGATPEDQAWCAARIAGLRFDGMFTPPSLEGSLVFPSNVGGAHWGGLAYDPVRQIVVVPINEAAAVVQLFPREQATDAPTGHERLTAEDAAMRGTPYRLRRQILLSPSFLPCTPPPFGSLVGVSLQTGAIVWRTPLGSMRELSPAREQLPADAAWGSINLGGPTVTASGLTFVAATPDQYVRAFETATGRELWQAKLPASGKATPMTYSAGGVQYVVVAAGGDGRFFGKSDQIIAFAVPPLRSITRKQ
ncbi:MAG: pyrroloquinoline quinone-dependent dehydrogenase [Gemmatimonadota bacterium]